MMSSVMSLIHIHFRCVFIVLVISYSFSFYFILYFGVFPITHCGTFLFFILFF